MLDELTHDRGDKPAGEEPGRVGFAAALRPPGGGWAGCPASWRAAQHPRAVPTLEVWVEPGTPPGTVPDEHRGVPVEVREARGISAFSADSRDAPVTAAGSCG